MISFFIYTDYDLTAEAEEADFYNENDFTIMLKSVKIKI